MEQVVKDILKIVTKHQIHSDSYDCEELESELLQLLRSNGRGKIKGKPVRSVITSDGIHLKETLDCGQKRYYVNWTEVAYFTYEKGTVISTERLEILFLEK